VDVHSTSNEIVSNDTRYDVRIVRGTKRLGNHTYSWSIAFTNSVQACLQSLAFEREAWRQNVIVTVKGTCNWLLEHPKYANWLNEPQGLLWIKGKPGAGKSTLMKFAVREIEQRKNMDGRVVASFFFNGRGDYLEKTPLGLFRSLLNQILPYFPDQLERLSSEFQKNCDTKGPVGEKWNWTLGHLQDCFASILPEVSGARPILIYIDALDESGAKVANDLVRYFRTLIFTIENKKASLRVCFSCRHFPIIALEQRLQICVEDENQSDIRAYLEEEVTVQGFRPEEARLLVKEIAQRAEGVFQWVNLVLGEVLTLYLRGNPSEVIQKIRDIPKGLDNLYGNLLQGIEQDDRRQSIKLLQWICFALRPLSLRELQQAMAIDVDATYGWLGAKQNSDNYAGTEEDMGRRIQYLSRGLAETRDAGQGRIAQFIHQSVRDYLNQGGFELLLLGDKSVSRMFKFDSVLAEGMIATSCLKYLCYARVLPASKTGNQSGDECTRDLANFFDQNALLKYSCLNWTFHLAQSCNQNHGIAKDLEDILTDFIGSSFRTVAWLQAIHYALHNGSSITTQVLERSIKGNLAYLNLSRNSYEEWLSRIFGQSGLPANFRYSYFLIDAPGGRFPPMHIAAFFDYADVVKSELDRGVRVDSLAAYNQSALACAAKGHSPNACKVLCEAGAKVNATDHIGQIALHIAITTWIKKIHQGHIDTFSVLLEAGSSLATQDRDGRTTMHLLCDVPEENHHVDALNVLLKHGRPEYAMIYDKSLETPLHVAARMGSLRLLKTLLKYIGVPDAFDLSTTTFTLTTTLMHSACSVPNNDDMVEWLIEAGVDINHQDTRYHRTPLHVTVANGGTYVRRLLVTRPKLELTDGDGSTPLHLAAIAQSSESARLLLEAGSNPFAINMGGQTVLGLIPLEGTYSSEVLFPVLEHIANCNLLFDESLSNRLEALIRSESRSFADAQQIALEINDTACFDIKPNDVLRVLLMLKELLRKQDPGHIAAAILDMAQYWVNSSCLCAVPDHFDGETSERAYLVSEPILGRPQQPVEQVVFTIDSHDQGWSVFHHLHGTYQGSHTWFEAQVVVADQPDAVVERRYIMTNVHASPRVRRHVVAWSANMPGSSQNDDLRAIEMWVRSLKSGDRIAVVPRARYLGWVNFVKLVKIDIMTSFLKRSSPSLRNDKNV
jgi:ankyrin repeat protein